MGKGKAYKKIPKKKFLTKKDNKKGQSQGIASEPDGDNVPARRCVALRQGSDRSGDALLAAVPIHPAMIHIHKLSLTCLPWLGCICRNYSGHDLLAHVGLDDPAANV